MNHVLEADSSFVFTKFEMSARAHTHTHTHLFNSCMIGTEVGLKDEKVISQRVSSNTVIGL